MVKLRMFQGHIANKDYAERIIAPAQDSIDIKEAQMLAESDPLCYLNVSMPEISTSPRKLSMKKSKSILDMFIDDDLLQNDSKKRIYIYRMHKDNHVQHGILALTSIDDYGNNLIKKHEHVLKKKEEYFTQQLDTQNANSEPVFLTYLGHSQIQERIMEVVNRDQCHEEVTCEDGIHHTLWLCSIDDSKFFIDQFSEVPELYICDGHHRSQAAYNVGMKRREEDQKSGKQLTGLEAYNYFMSLIVPEPEVKILEYNRLVKTLNGLSSEDFLQQLSEKFEVSRRESWEHAPSEKHRISMFLDNQWHDLALKDEHSQNFQSVLDQIDAEILTQSILAPILGIADLKKDERIDFVGGNKGIEELERRCHQDCVAAFALHPISMKEIVDVVNIGKIMPPKSTWFEPKPRSGFVVRCFYH